MLEEETRVQSQPVVPSPWLETSPEEGVLGHSLSALPSLLVHDALATVWSPLSHLSVWSAFLDWPVQLRKPVPRMELCAEHVGLLGDARAAIHSCTKFLASSSAQP